MDIAAYILIPLVGLLGSLLERRINRLHRKVETVEHKVDLILDHLGISVPGPDLSRVRTLLAADKKIEAIKAYREVTDADLKEAKDAVERMEA